MGVKPESKLLESRRPAQNEEKTHENHKCAKRASLRESTCKNTNITECRKTTKNGQKNTEKHGKTTRNKENK